MDLNEHQQSTFKGYCRVLFGMSRQLSLEFVLRNIFGERGKLHSETEVSRFQERAISAKLVFDVVSDLVDVRFIYKRQMSAIKLDLLSQARKFNGSCAIVLLEVG